MKNAAKALLDEILESGAISMRALAREIRVKPSTLSRIKSGKTEGGTVKTYLKIMQYRQKVIK